MKKWKVPTGLERVKINKLVEEEDSYIPLRTTTKYYYYEYYPLSPNCIVERVDFLFLKDRFSWTCTLHIEAASHACLDGQTKHFILYSEEVPD